MSHGGISQREREIKSGAVFTALIQLDPTVRRVFRKKCGRNILETARFQIYVEYNGIHKKILSGRAAADADVL